MSLLDASGKPVQTGQTSDSSSTDSNAAKPSYLTAADLAERDSKMSQLAESMSELKGLVQGMASRPAAAAPVATIEEHDLTDEEINRAFQGEDGSNPAAVIRALSERVASKRGSQLEQQLRQLETYGVQNFAHFAEQTVTALPHFRRFEKEIRKEVDNYSQHIPATRGMPLVWKGAYDLVLGRHADELANEAAEEAVRRARETGGLVANLPGNEPKEPQKLSDGSPVPSAKDVGGTEAEAALRYKKTDQDRLASAMGYETWAQFQDQINLKDPYEDDSFLFPKGKGRGPSFGVTGRA